MNGRPRHVITKIAGLAQFAARRLVEFAHLVVGVRMIRLWSGTRTRGGARVAGQGKGIFGGLDLSINRMSLAPRRVRQLQALGG